jgi:hypothetical protein
MITSGGNRNLAKLDRGAGTAVGGDISPACPSSGLVPNATEPVRPSEREAARTVIQLAQDQQIVLPMSFAHVSETCQWSDPERRYNHAVTLLQLSAGWDVSDPAEVRRYELRQMLLEEIPVASPIPLEVITLQAGALTGDRLAGARQMAVDLPFAEQADLHHAGGLR